MNIKTGLITVGDDREEFYKIREPLVLSEIESLSWLKEKYNVLEFEPITSEDDFSEIVKTIKEFDIHSLLIHIPIWAPPSLTLNICRQVDVPIMLIGNSDSQTSSTVGLLGAGGALNQVGIEHKRIFDKDSLEGRSSINAFLAACSSKRELIGQKYAKFGSYSLGIFTAEADPAQWQKIFGVDTITIDQLEIVNIAESLDSKYVRKHYEWFVSCLGNGEDIKEDELSKIEKQIRSYLATYEIIKDRKIDFVGVKCQPEMSDGYVSQCAAHMLLNSSLDTAGKQGTIVHACEADSDGALTMQILKLLSGGKPSALLDIRFYDYHKGIWVFANCGAIACDFYNPEPTKDPLKNVKAMPHVFGKGGGLAYSGTVSPQCVTLARLYRIDGEYKMTILKGEVVSEKSDHPTTKQFPRAYIRLEKDNSFLEEFGSNHIHMVSGDYSKELEYFCDLCGIEY